MKKTLLVFPVAFILLVVMAVSAFASAASSPVPQVAITHSSKYADARLEGLTITWKGYGDIHTYHDDSTGRWLTRHATLTVTFDFPVRGGHRTRKPDEGYLDAEGRYIDWL